MKLSDLYERLVDEDVTVGFRAYDGSTAGPQTGDFLVELRSPLALRYLLTAPGELGLARAYVTGALDIQGDLHAVLVELLAHRRVQVRKRDALRVVGGLGRSALRPPPIPPEEAPPPPPPSPAPLGCPAPPAACAPASRRSSSATRSSSAAICCRAQSSMRSSVSQTLRANGPQLRREPGGLLEIGPGHAADLDAERARRRSRRRSSWKARVVRWKA